MLTLLIILVLLLLTSTHILGNNVTQFVSAGRATPYTPTPGSIGAIQVQGTLLNLLEFEPDIKNDKIDVSNLLSPVDPINGVLNREYMGGPNDGEFSIRGQLDRSVVGWRPHPGDTGFIYLYYSANFFYNFSYLVVSTANKDSAVKSGEFACNVAASGLINWNGRTNLGGNTSNLPG